MNDQTLHSSHLVIKLNINLVSLQPYLNKTRVNKNASVTWRVNKNHAMLTSPDEWVIISCCRVVNEQNSNLDLL